MSANDVPWTDEEVQALLSLSPQLSLSEKARALHEMGFSRRTKNSVGGKLDRLAATAGRFTRTSRTPQERKAGGAIMGNFRSKGCQWIEHEPAANDLCKCLAPVKPGTAWCAEHYPRVYDKAG